MHFHRILAACAVAAVCASTTALAQESAASYPSKPVTIVIPFATGNPIDAELYLYTEKMQASTKQSWLLDYRGGAGSTIGVLYAMKAKPDGYTILATTSSLAFVPNFYPEANHSVISQLVPVTEMSRRDAGVVISTTALPNVRNLADLSAYGKANPGKLTCNTGGAGTGVHVSCVILGQEIGAPITAVHYKSAGPGMLDLAAGRISLATAPLVVTAGHLSNGSGKMRVIAIAGPTRAKSMPDIPTSHEQGYDVEYLSWYAIFAPPKTPPAIVNKLNAEFVAAIKAPDTVAGLDKLGAIAVGSSSAEFSKKFAAEVALAKKVVEVNKITME